MAQILGIGSKMKGSAGAFTFRRNSGMTLVSERVTEVRNVRSAAQQQTRMKWGNIIQMYKGISPLLYYGFENKAQGVTDYNMFVKVNMQQVPVYLTKGQKAGGACVVAPYQITQGSLPTIEVTGEGANRVTDIKLGDLTIGETTTVAEFALAVVANNREYGFGDKISFFNILQKYNATSGIPYAVFDATNVVLDKENKALLWSVVDRTGFVSKEGKLAHGDSQGDGAFCWVHTRRSDKGKTLVSSQSLLDNNSLLANYISPEAYQCAVATYGGESDVFLKPNSTYEQTPATGGSNGNSVNPEI